MSIDDQVILVLASKDEHKLCQTELVFILTSQHWRLTSQHCSHLLANTGEA